MTPRTTLTHRLCHLMSSFLVTYNRRTGDVDVREYVGERGRSEALAERVAVERTRTTHDVEVVVLSADSVEELRRTHGRYFKSAAELLAGLDPAAPAA
jgi:hypothetical protein